MFCVVGLEQTPVGASFKVTDEEFDEMAARPGFSPAPYVAKYKWVAVSDIQLLKPADWKKYLAQSHRLVASKLSAKKRKELGLPF
jgi:predicted DNA-binding protein (MmcQ/YjbR family)